MKTFFSIILLIASFTIVRAQTAGSVCIAKFNPPTSGEKSLGNPTGGDSTHKYKIQIDKKAILGSYENGVKVSGLSTKQNHFIKIYKDDALIESFKFGFGEFKGSKLCLYLKELYQTWQLSEAKVSPWCKCN